MEFKVGDRVLIRHWDDMCEEFGYPASGQSIDVPFSFTEEMRHLCGREATVKNITCDRIELDDWSDKDGDVVCSYSKEMLTLVRRAKTITPEPKKMTLSDIEKQLGYKFVIVSSK